MGWLNSSVYFDNVSFEVRNGFNRQSMNWDEIDIIYGEKLDKITYKELFLIVSSHSGANIVIGEMDEGFVAWEACLKRILGDFAPDWRALLEVEEPGMRKKIWHRREVG